MSNFSLEDEIVAFIKKWAPKEDIHQRSAFFVELRALLEMYGINALAHGNLPDTDHPHRDIKKGEHNG